VELNTVKRGLADIDLDFDVVLNAIQKVNDETEAMQTLEEKTLIIYNVIYLVTHREFSVRDFAQHAF